MCEAVYNSAISIILKPVISALRALLWLRLVLLFVALGGLAVTACATDWNTPEQHLARKIVAVTGPGAVALTVENRSSLGKRDFDIIQNGLRSALDGVGLRFVKADQAAATVTIALSENLTSYVWVADIHQGAGESAVVMVSTARPEGSTVARDSVPLSLRRTLLWTQVDPMLDVAVLEEGSSPTRLAVLDPEKVSLYHMQGGAWQQEAVLTIAHSQPWPRDLRGRLISARDHLLDVYLPGVICTSTSSLPLTLNCRESDDPWPLIAGTVNGGSVSVFPSAGLASGASTVVPQMKAFFAPRRNFFTGALTPGVGKFATGPKFYSAALLPRDKYTLWLFAAVDGQTHLIDGVSDQALKLGWGSDLTSVKTACGAGWQVLSSAAVRPEDDQADDAVRAYEFPNRDPVAVSAAVDFAGPVTALWTEAKGESAIAVARNRETGSYEAFRLAMACGQ